MGSNRPPTASEVNDALTFATFVQARLGCPTASLQDLKLLKKKAKAFFEAYPTASWQTLVEVALWSHGKKRRQARVWGYVEEFRHAYAYHAIDLPRGDDFSGQIAAALEQETDRAWRSRLRMAAGDQREVVLAEWEMHRQVSPT